MEKQTQFGESVTGDFEESTWTFEMPKGFKLYTGHFAIVDKEDHAQLVKMGDVNILLNSLKNIATLHRTIQPIDIFDMATAAVMQYESSKND